jgi:hypothetical protein
MELLRGGKALDELRHRHSPVLAIDTPPRTLRVDSEPRAQIILTVAEIRRRSDSVTAREFDDRFIRRAPPDHTAHHERFE